MLPTRSKLGGETGGPCNVFPTFPAGNCMFKVNNRNTRIRCEIGSKLTIKTLERR